MVSKGWIGVDLDGTLFEYHEWVGWNVFGAPIPQMIHRVQRWIVEGREVRIVTARVDLPINDGQSEPIPSYYKTHVCRVTGEKFSDRMMVRAVQAHCVAHGLPALRVQCHKGVDMIELWDDRAVQVVPNTGRTLAEEHVAELSALRGKAFQS
jgi:hypothetical protein